MSQWAKIFAHEDCATKGAWPTQKEKEGNKGLQTLISLNVAK